jgi:uncharacterized membrane protein
MKNNSPNSTSLLLIIGLFIRLGISPFTKDPWDMNVWKAVGLAILSGQNPYALTSNALIYPPLWGIFCTLSYLLYTLNNNPFILYFTLKLPIIIADVLISLIIKKMVYNQTFDIKKARTAILLYLFNPITLIMSSLWGMFDAIPTLFAFLSLFYLLKGEYLKSGLSLGAGVGFKGFFPALLLPFFLFYIWKKEKRISKCLHFTIYSIVIPLIISIPFLIIDPHAYISKILFPTKRLPQGLTYWFLIREIFKANQISSATIITISSFSFILSFSMLYIFLIRKANSWSIEENPRDTRFILKGSILIIFIFYITSNTVNEQHLIWAIPFLIAYIASYNQSLNPILCVLCGLDTFFVILNVGPNFFSPIIDIPLWWRNFQYSTPSIIIMILVGILFSVVCLMVYFKLTKITN